MSLRQGLRHKLKARARPAWLVKTQAQAQGPATGASLAGAVDTLRTCSRLRSNHHPWRSCAAVSKHGSNVDAGFAAIELPRPHLEHAGLGLRLVRNPDIHQLVHAPRPQQRGVQQVRAVGGTWTKSTQPMHTSLVICA